MADSPFHGIFSALQQKQDDDANLFADEAEDDVDEVPPQRESAPGVGRVAVDIYESEGYYIIKAPIAGVRLMDLDLEVKEKEIVIRGNRRQTDDIATDQYYLQECFWGPFSRSVTLPFEIDPKKVRATFSKDSILKILIPKEEKVRIVRIQEG